MTSLNDQYVHHDLIKFIMFCSYMIMLVMLFESNMLENLMLVPAYTMTDIPDLFMEMPIFS